MLPHPAGPPELIYDTVSRRDERGSRAVGRPSSGPPRCALFGHVHQPLVRRIRVGRTECMNVGHFRATGVPFVLDW